MTAHQSASSFVDAAGQIAAKPAETATMQDKAGQVRLKELDLPRRLGLLKLLILAEDGGPGRRLTDALEVIRTIVSGNNSIRQLTGHHYACGVSQDLRSCVRRDQHSDA
jgi:hypothetical protein